MPEQTTHDFRPGDEPDPVAVPVVRLAQIGRYRLLQLLGEGAFGKVYRAHDPNLDREVALKVPKFGAEQQELRERFLQEARAAAKLQHPNVVTVFDCGAAGDDEAFIATELIDGATLAERLRAERPGHRQAAQWARDVALALEYAHAQGLVHRDVKPANVMVDRTQRARLMDFGLAKRAAEPDAAGPGPAAPDVTLTRVGAIVGTPAYMAPEQARGEAEKVGPPSDQYALGVMLYEMLVGRRPFGGASLGELLARVADSSLPPAPPRDLDAEVPLGLEAVVLKALQKDPAARYASAGELAVDLHRWLKGEAVHAPLLIRGRLVKKCPECKKRNAGERARCAYCDADLTAVEPRDTGKPGPGSAPAPLRPKPLPGKRPMTRPLAGEGPEAPPTRLGSLRAQFEALGVSGLLFGVLALALVALLAYAGVAHLTENYGRFTNGTEFTMAVVLAVVFLGALMYAIVKYRQLF